MSTTKRWQQVWKIFEEAIEQPPKAREAFLDEACGRDEKLRRGVEEMLAADDQADSLLDQPIVQRGTGGSLEIGRIGPADRPSPRGTRIGPYRIQRRIGQGGMGTVYLAVRADDAFQRRVVVKLVRRGMESEAVLRRLRTERQILASLEHPYIARLYDGGSTDDGLPYFVLEYVEGEPIDKYCEQNRLSVDERLTLFRKVCAAVHYAHQNLVVHRDLKPSNILVVAAGEPKLLDFGIAKLLNPELASSELEPTATWHRILTPSYASPEQIRGKLITTASDVYSLGVLLYKLLTDRLPYHFAGRSADEIERLLNDSEPLPPSVAATRPAVEEGSAEPASAAAAGPSSEPGVGELRRTLAGDLDAIVLKALRAAPQHRYGSVEQLAADIERHQLGRPVEARPPTWGYRAGKFVRRHRSAVAAALAVALLVLGFAVAMALQATRVAFERDQARRERDKKAEVLSLVLELFELSNPYVVPGEELSVREALERSVPVLEGRLGEQPDVRGELLHTSGSILRVLGVYDAARSQLEEALEIRMRRHGEDHPDVAATLSALAAAYKGQGELDAAEELARRAVDIARGLADGSSSTRSAVDLAEPLNELVSVLCYRHEYEAAETLATRALALTRELPAGSAKRIIALEHLARIRSEQEDYREAVRLNREALALRRARDGEKHPEQIATLNNLGMGLRNMEDLEAAEHVYQEALRLQRDNFGADHDDPYLLNNLGGLLLARSEWKGAEKLFREGREAVIQSAGPEHWMVFFFELRIARTRLSQGAFAEAEGDLRHLLEDWRTRLGDHWRFDVGVGLLGESISEQGRCAEAEPLLIESFHRLHDKSKVGSQQDAVDRLRDHFERCGKPREIERFEAILGIEEGQKI